MKKNNNRTWVEDGSFSLPKEASSKSPLSKLMGFLYWPIFFVLMTPFLNAYWRYYFKIRISFFNIRFAWETLARMTWHFGPIYDGTFWALVPTAILFIVAIYLFRVLVMDKGHGEEAAALHGSSHWAEYEEIKAAGLVNNKGAIVGGFERSAPGWKLGKSKETIYLKDEGPTHIIAIAPTRSGKGISLVVPTLLTWQESVFVLDIKGENWLLSSGWRNQNIGPCVRFEPTDPSGLSARYNPLAEIKVGTPDETREVQTIASMLIDPDGKGLDDHWTKAAFTILTGAITHEIYASRDQGREPSIERVRDELASGDCAETLANWKSYKHFKDKPHPIVLKVVREVEQKAEKELSGVFSTANAALGLWTDPTICANTTNHTFRIHDLVNGAKPASLYVVIPPSDLTRLRPILRLFVTQIVFALTQKMTTKDGAVSSGHAHRLLLMLDEFPQLRKLDLFEAALAFIGGYGIKAYMICQSFKQLTDIYGKDETISANCRVQICYAPNDEDTARIVSEKCGKGTVTVGSSSISGKRFAFSIFGKTQESISYSQQARELLTPDETRRLRTAKMQGYKVVEGGDMLIFASGTAPIYGKQTPFFLDEVLDARSKIAPPTESFTTTTLQDKSPEDLALEMQTALRQETSPLAPARSMEITEDFDMSPQELVKTLDKSTKTNTGVLPPQGSPREYENIKLSDSLSVVTNKDILMPMDEFTAYEQNFQDEDDDDEAFSL